MFLVCGRKPKHTQHADSTQKDFQTDQGVKPRTCVIVLPTHLPCKRSRDVNNNTTGSVSWWLTDPSVTMLLCYSPRLCWNWLGIKNQSVRNFSLQPNTHLRDLTRPASNDVETMRLCSENSLLTQPSSSDQPRGNLWGLWCKKLGDPLLTAQDVGLRHRFVQSRSKQSMCVRKKQLRAEFPRQQTLHSHPLFTSHAPMER